MTRGWMSEWEAAKEAREEERMMTDQIKKWEALKAAAKQAAEAERVADRALDDFAEQHRRDNPLSPATCTILRDRVRAGKKLCCTEGTAFLVAVVDPIWAERISEWAYEALGCNPGRHVEDDLKVLNRLLSEPQ